jgi:hypothetical protein
MEEKSYVAQTEITGRRRKWFTSAESDEMEAKSNIRVEWAFVVKEAKDDRGPYSQGVNK